MQTLNWKLGKGWGANSVRVGEDVSSYEECVELVTRDKPEANGISVGPGGRGKCLAEFDMTDRYVDAPFESAFLDGREVPVLNGIWDLESVGN